MGKQDWKRSLLDSFTDSVRAQVITKKAFVDVTCKPQKVGTEHTSSVAAPEDAITRLALELDRVKT